MPLTPEMRYVLIAALGAFIAVFMAFGYRSCDKADKFDEKANELNEIRMEMRSKDTLPALDKLQKYVADTNKKEKKGDRGVTDLFYDTTRKEFLNKLVNDIERTFKNSNRVGEALDSLVSAYRQRGRAIYIFVAIVGLGGFGLIILDSGLAFLESEVSFVLLCVLLVVIVILRLQVIVAKSRIIHSSQETYQKAKKEYLVDEVRVRD